MRQSNVERLVARFPFLQTLASDEYACFTRSLMFPVLEAGQTAYALEEACPNYLMCIEGRTRIFKTSEGGREMLIYNVEPGGTCVLTTQCLLSRTNFPAESIAETRTSLAAIPADSFYRFMDEMPTFRSFVMSDYTKLLGTMFAFVDALAFQTLEQRLARRLLVEAGETLLVEKTHQQLASDIGSVREIVSRRLGDWERNGWVRNARGQIRILDRAALASRQVA